LLFEAPLGFFALRVITSIPSQVLFDPDNLDIRFLFGRKLAAGDATVIGGDWFEMALYQSSD